MWHIFLLIFQGLSKKCSFRFLTLTTKVMGYFVFVFNSKKNGKVLASKMRILESCVMFLFVPFIPESIYKVHIAIVLKRNLTR